MLVPSLTWPWIGEVIQGAVDVVESGELGVMLFTCNQGDESMRRFASQVNAKAFDGLLVIEPEGTLDYITELHTGGLPVVLIDDRESRPQFASVATTNRAGGRAGRAPPAGDRPPPPGGRHRQAGFRLCLRTARGLRRGLRGGRASGCRPPPCWRATSASPRATPRWRGPLADGVEFDAVFAHNDLSAAGALQALREAGIAVPGDVAVVGFDDVEFTALTEPPLTTVRQPLRELGATAARLLTAHLGGESLPAEPVVIPTGFVVRGSTAPQG